MGAYVSEKKRTEVQAKWRKQMKVLKRPMTICHKSRSMSNSILCTSKKHLKMFLKKKSHISLGNAFYMKKTYSKYTMYLYYLIKQR